MKLAKLDIKKKLLMGAGPSEVWPNVLKALSLPPLGHLDPKFNEIMESCKYLLRYIFQTKNEMTFPVSGTGSAAMELCFTNMIQPGDEVLVCNNGIFGYRMKLMCEILGANVFELTQPWGEAVDLVALEELLIKNSNIKFVCVVHGETSTGVLSDIESIAKLAKKHNAVTIVDAVTSIAGVPFYMDDWGIDVVYSGSQKCLSCIPGISLVSFSKQAVQLIKARSYPITSWYFDLNLISQYWFVDGKHSRSYHHTAPVNNIFALYQSLLNIYDLGLQQSWQAHKSASDYLKDRLAVLGLVTLVDSNIALPQLSVVKIPEYIEDQVFREGLLRNHDIEISSGLGSFFGKVWRIGLMGCSATKENIDKLIHAFTQLL